MTPLITLITIAGYFALLFIISWASNRKKGEYFGGRQTPWIVSAIAMMGAPISGVTFISVPGMVVGKDFSYMQMAFGFIVGYIIIAYLLLPLFYKKKLISIYGYLEERFGAATHRTGAWFFFVSKMLGAAVRFFVVCIVLQSLVFSPLGIPFWANVIVSVSLIGLYTAQGGVKTVIWTDMLKSACLVFSVVLSIVFIAKGLGVDFTEMVSTVAQNGHSRIFFFDNPSEGSYFWKQFTAGIFMVIATTGLDQDMIQRNLSCRNYKDSQKGFISSVFSQALIIFLFLVLGVLLMLYYQANISQTGDIAAELGTTDALFGAVVASEGMPLVVGILFVVGLIAAAYSAAGSALTALTTAFTMDILKSAGRPDKDRTRKRVHTAMAVCMGIVIILFNAINSQDAISAVYSIASYTYGPILGLFSFGLFCKKSIRDKWVPLICVIAPVICYFIQNILKNSCGYTMGFELLLLNAVITVAGLCVLGKRKMTGRTEVEG